MDIGVFIVYKVDTRKGRLISFEYPAEAACRSGINIDKGGFIPHG
jgi:hypothetical protein